MSIVLNGDSGITTPTYGGADTSEYLVPVTQFKNRLINSDMRIDQRNAGASVTPTNGAYTLDRWRAEISTTNKFTVQQSSTAPAGFTNSLLITSSSAYTVGASDYFAICQPIEGYNIADLNFGSANAKTVTLSFWVRSSVTGTYSAVLVNQNDTRVYPFTYTVSSANTFEYKTVTIAGDTTGTWLATNGAGIRVNFYIGLGTNFQGSVNAWNSGTVYGSSGTTNLVSTNGATFYITGVQLEVGSTATSFDYRPYGTELALCQRYFEKSAEPQTPINTANDSAFLVSNLYNNIGNGDYYANVIYKVTKRAAPTLTLYPYSTPSNTTRWSNDTGTDYGANSAVVPNGSKTWGFNVANTSGGTLTVGPQKLIIGNWYANAEL